MQRLGRQFGSIYACIACADPVTQPSHCSVSPREELVHMCRCSLQHGSEHRDWKPCNSRGILYCAEVKENELDQGLNIGSCVPNPGPQMSLIDIAQCFCHI